ncbi:hypothetical protein MWU50_00055 [Flavobacteriaceae bacterium S0862]|nr:hypothetical protein [Flavobacteriaceae bacterium S0862]
MKSKLHKIFSFAMAFVVLFSTMSFTINKHFCGNTLVDTALFVEAKTCGMEEQVSNNTDDAITKNNCCSTEELLIEGQDNLKLDFTKFDLQQKIFVSTFVYTYINLFEGITKESIHFKDYSPPLIVKDIHTLDEVYLI